MRRDYERNKKEERSDSLIQELLEVWENSVRATHKFLSNEEILEIKKYVLCALKGVSHLIIETDKDGKPIAFMGTNKNKLEMLFITSLCRGKGIGKRMLLYGIENFGVNEVTVNEDNPTAKGFYEHMEFKVYQRNELDNQGKHFPVLYMKLK